MLNRWPNNTRVQRHSSSLCRHKRGQPVAISPLQMIMFEIWTLRNSFIQTWRPIWLRMSMWRVSLARNVSRSKIRWCSTSTIRVWSRYTALIMQIQGATSSRHSSILMMSNDSWRCPIIRPVTTLQPRKPLSPTRKVLVWSEPWRKKAMVTSGEVLRRAKLRMTSHRPLTITAAIRWRTLSMALCLKWTRGPRKSLRLATARLTITRPTECRSGSSPTISTVKRPNLKSSKSRSIKGSRCVASSTHLCPYPSRGSQRPKKSSKTERRNTWRKCSHLAW